MKFSAILAAAALSVSGASAAPADTVSMMAASPQWTIREAKRWCNADDSLCAWKFGIDVGSGTVTPCKFEVKKGAKPASQTAGGPATCGAYTITTGWSDQFGKDQGFTTLSVVDQKKRLIIWPAYTDKQVAGAVIVKPDQSYAPAKLP